MGTASGNQRTINNQFEQQQQIYIQKVIISTAKKIELNQYNSNIKPIPVQNKKPNSFEFQQNTSKQYQPGQNVNMSNQKNQIVEREDPNDIWSNKQSNNCDENGYIKFSFWIWDKSEIPFVIDESFEQHQIRLLMEAIQEFETNTSIQFRQYKTNPKDPEIKYIKYFQQYEKGMQIDEDCGYTEVIGRQQNMQEHKIFISKGAKLGTYLHETMHILGFEHEQCRKDRNRFVCVKFNLDVPEDIKFQYQIKGFILGKYDVKSIMHYQVNEYMTANNLKHKEKMGKNQHLSQGDIQGLNLVYSMNCTFDKYGDQSIYQIPYKCNQCWGKQNIQEFCLACAQYCHTEDFNNKKHIIQIGDIKSFSCNCGQQQHIFRQCTRNITGHGLKQQPMYFCLTCLDDIGPIEKLIDLYAICRSCILKCHRGHSKSFIGLFEHYCKCKTCNK